MLLLRKSSLWRCYKPRHVTKQDLSVLCFRIFFSCVRTSFPVLERTFPVIEHLSSFRVAYSDLEHPKNVSLQKVKV
jgi:hypothetical protein